ncbi:hypothetical protein, partial [Moorena sp. SIO4G3]|uniref:hypothetical protein n=1 Tax=Moorena sp. SIO4G3 TaxID=2607821 RepID=UPI0025D0B3B7
RTLGTAFLIFSVSGLTSTRVFVRVNNVVVGEITPNQSNLTWFTQMISLAGSQLNGGNNEVQIEATNDSFRIKNMVCFFHQNV